LLPGVHLIELLTSEPKRAQPWLFTFTWVIRGRLLEWIELQPGEPERPADGILMLASGRVTDLGFYRRAGDKDLAILPPPHRLDVTAGPCLVLRVNGPRLWWRNAK
jgi:hypothetical protein